MVRLCVILDSGTSEACDEFVDVSYALNWAKWITISKGGMNGQSPIKELSLPSEIILFQVRPVLIMIILF